MGTRMACYGYLSLSVCSRHRRWTLTWIGRVPPRCQQSDFGHDCKCREHGVELGNLRYLRANLDSRRDHKRLVERVPRIELLLLELGELEQRGRVDIREHILVRERDLVLGVERPVRGEPGLL